MWTPKIPEPIGLQVCDVMHCAVKVKMMSKGILHKVASGALLQLLKGFSWVPFSHMIAYLLDLKPLSHWHDFWAASFHFAIHICNEKYFINYIWSSGVASAPGRPKIELSSRVSAPEDDSVTDEINLTWDVPEDDGGYPITGRVCPLGCCPCLPCLNTNVLSLFTIIDIRPFWHEELFLRNANISDSNLLKIHTSGAHLLFVS